MLGVFCSRPKPACILPSSLSLSPRRLSSLSLLPASLSTKRHVHFSPCNLNSVSGASIWHAILLSGRANLVPVLHHGSCGEGSWNVAWDARPARWLHRTDSVWLLFGVCACRASLLQCGDVNSANIGPKVGYGGINDVLVTDEIPSRKFTVTGVKADGRCLFRAIAHVASLKNGEEAPDENRQRELADDLRAQVVDELIKRRKETKWFIEEDFDVYVNRIQQSYVWGGEPELLMASHVIKTPISVYEINKSSGSLMKIADYGEEYQKDEETPITVLFHRYGHYDILEAVKDQHEKRSIVPTKRWMRTWLSAVITNRKGDTFSPEKFLEKVDQSVSKASGKVVT